MVWHHFHDDLMLSTVQTLILFFSISTPASAGINCFTVLGISEMFNFSSPACFSCYVQRYLGESPSEYRR